MSRSRQQNADSKPPQSITTHAKVNAMAELVRPMPVVIHSHTLLDCVFYSLVVKTNDA